MDSSPWSYLPMDVLWTVAQRLGHRDLFHFGHTCKSWNSVFQMVQDIYPRQLAIRHCLPRSDPPPLLMLHCKEDSEFREFYSVRDEKVVSRILLPGIRGKWVCGSSPDGWLVMAEIYGPEFFLLNPFTGDRIRLPPSHTMWNLDRRCRIYDLTTTNYFVNNVLVAPEPHAGGGDRLAMAIVSGATRSLSFCRFGDVGWRRVRDSPSKLQAGIYHKNKFYVVNDSGTLISCDFLGGSVPKFTIVAGKSRPPPYYASRVYLVEAMGELFQVVRKYVSCEGRGFLTTTGFEIFKLQEKGVAGEDELTELGEQVFFYEKSWESFPHGAPLHVEAKEEDIKCKWVKMMDGIGDSVFFLGFNHSLSTSAAIGEGNKIYFTDDDEHSCFRRNPSNEFCFPCHDSGVFSFADGKIYDYDPNAYAELFFPSIWIRPNPW